MSKWNLVSEKLPPNGLVVETKISDPERNIADLIRKGNLWFLKDESMYVYYVPTHWRNKEVQGG